MDIKSFPRIVLLLGSYDPRTKEILMNVKERLSQGLMSHHETVLVLLLEDVEIYKARAEGKEMTIIAERYDNKVSLFIFDDSSIIDAIDLPAPTDVEITTKEYLAKTTRPQV